MGQTSIISVLAAMRRASPEVAPYPFTTVTPNLGVTQVGENAESSGRLVLADLPGLIEGAHQVRFNFFMSRFVVCLFWSLKQQLSCTQSTFGG